MSLNSIYADSLIGKKYAYDLSKKIEKETKETKKENIRKKYTPYHAARERFVSVPKVYMYLFSTPLIKSLTNKEIKILNYILLKTFGFHKLHTYLDKEDISKHTGCRKDLVVLGLKQLQEKNMICIEETSKEKKHRYKIYTQYTLSINPFWDTGNFDISYLYNIPELYQQVDFDDTTQTATIEDVSTQNDSGEKEKSGIDDDLIKALNDLQ